jgi:deoxyxylulose-5-phosphate synthase
VVAALDKPVAKVYGDVLAFISSESLAEIQRLNIDKSEVLVTSLRGAFGDRLPMVLGHPAFAKDILRKVVDNMLHMNQEKDKLMASFALTCKAMVPTVNEWLAKQPR